MNIEIADRLVELRRSHGFSQEELAHRLGLSRQAISKWERAEASPDTDNLIALSRLYGISLDELLLIDTPTPAEEAPEAEPEEPAPAEDTDVHLPHKNGHIDWSGIHIHDGEDEVHIGWRGIHVKDAEDEVHVSLDGIHVDEGDTHVHLSAEELADWKQKRWHRILADMPCCLLVTLAFLALGFAGGWWHPAWLLFLLIPLYHTAVEAIAARDPHKFAYPVLVTGVYLALGFFGGWWHPAWLVFLTIPLYYLITEPFHKK